MDSFLKSQLVLAIGALVLFSIDHGGVGVFRGCEATIKGVDHVVGGDPGWEANTDVATWAVNKIFTVGDSIWFAYSAAEERIVEVESKEEFESCKVGNPIRMYTEGLSRVSLENEGSRYFISSSSESCKNGLKLHVNVQPQSKAVREIKGDDAVNRGVAAEGPKPSSCSHFHQGSSLKWFAMAFICFIISLRGL
ncbi:uclacyanin 1-like [Ananas comosus]|uniref:Uclacyanin 1-like n=1 Tax=Ananas comosus TaxID=4615 RepID=A0A6P5F2W5_ANACO|nr:uclacyanin 1-like [Ananas comosus]